MLLLRGYERWNGISFPRDPFSAVAGRRKLYVIIILCEVSAYVVLCCRDLVYLVENLCFRYCIECLFICHEDTDALAEVADMDVDIPQEVAACPSFHDCDCLCIHFGKGIVPWKTLIKGSGFLPLCVKIPVFFHQRRVYLTSGI